MPYGIPTKPGAPPCGLYLTAPQDRETDQIFRELREIFLCINASEYEKNFHILAYHPESAGHAFDLDRAQKLAELCRTNGIVFLCHNDISSAAKALADGVILNDPAQIATAREVFGEEGIIGLRCENSIAKALEGLDLGVDLASFSATTGFLPDPTTLRRWHIATDKPCLAEGLLTNDYCDFYVSAGADFIDSSHYIWTHPEGVKQATVNMLYAIDLALARNAQKDAPEH